MSRRFLADSNDYIFSSFFQSYACLCAISPNLETQEVKRGSLCMYKCTRSCRLEDLNCGHLTLHCGSDSQRPQCVGGVNNATAD